MAVALARSKLVQVAVSVTAPVLVCPALTYHKMSSFSVNLAYSESSCRLRMYHLCSPLPAGFFCGKWHVRKPVLVWNEILVKLVQNPFKVILLFFCQRELTEDFLCIYFHTIGRFIEAGLHE